MREFQAKGRRQEEYRASRRYDYLFVYRANLPPLSSSTNQQCARSRERILGHLRKTHDPVQISDDCSKIR